MNTNIKRIAFISDHASPLAVIGGVDTGGQNVYVAQLALHLATQNYQIDIFTRSEDPCTEEIVNWKPGIRVIHIEAGPVAVLPKEELLPYMEQFEKNMLAFISHEQTCYELIHAHFFMSALVGLGIKKQLDIPVVVTFHALGHVRRIHQGDDDRFPVERLEIEKRAMAEADHIIAECPQDKEDLINYYQADSSRISIIPCGFNPAEIYPVSKELARKKLGLPQNVHILLQLGRMVPRKGIDNVIMALGKLKAQGVKKLKLLVVGGKSEQLTVDTCPEYHRLKTLAQSLGIAADVIFTGQRSRAELKLYYSAADIFITTPWYEPFGITPLEAMACGTPVIGSDVGGIKYSVAHGQTGTLVPPNDAAALAKAITNMFQNPKLLSRFGKNALERVHKIFTWQKVSQQISGVYVGVINGLQNLSVADKNKAA